MLRIGHQVLSGKTTLKKQTIIDVLETWDDGIGRFMAFDHEKNKVVELRLDDEDIYIYLSNGIDRPETQDKVGRFTVGDGECESHLNKISVGRKVKFKTEFKKATLEIQGYVVRNFWSNYYLISECGVSVSGRYWKVSHDKVSKC
tara:strand:- start:2021 stop:2455 length:435 start_codon:yes stop_codon:yes gene_type:complete